MENDFRRDLFSNESGDVDALRSMAQVPLKLAEASHEPLEIKY
jgi:hypothetical protein